MTSRNAPCPCGSGKKFKRCHGSQPLPGQTQPGQPELVSPSPPHAVGIRTEVTIAVPTRAPSGTAFDTGSWQQVISALLSESRVDEAWHVFRQMPIHSPDDSGVHYFRGVLLQLSGRRDEALDAYSEAICLASRTAAEPHSRNSKALSVAAALQLFETAAGNYPGSTQSQPQGMFGCAQELAELEGRLDAWEDDLRSSGHRPTGQHARKFAVGWYNLGCAALSSYTRGDRAAWLFQKALELDPEDMLPRLNRVFAMNYSDKLGAEEIYRAHRDAGQWMERRFAPQSHFARSSRQAKPRIRLAYLSSDFREHSVAHFILPVLRQHDRSKFELFLYHNHSREDDYTRSARQFADRFSPVSHLSDEALCQAIKADEIDVLIDLNGLTEHHRMAVLAMRAAPVQIHWLGYPNTTGLGTIDYRIVDELTDPPPHAQDVSVERLLYLPRSFSAYQAPAGLPEVAAPPVVESGHITFGSFNSLPKLNDALLQTWCKILLRVPGSKILLKNVAFSHDEPRQQVREVFANSGIQAERVELMGASPGKREHLRSLGRVDIALDSFPYNGTTTTCDSLIMGVPVVTRSGTEHRSRVGASLLSAVQLESLVARDDNDYIEIACRLATNRELLLSTRSGLRERVQGSSMMDAGALTRGLESKLEQAWADWCRQE